MRLGLESLISRPTVEHPDQVSSPVVLQTLVLPQGRGRKRWQETVSPASRCVHVLPGPESPLPPASDPILLSLYLRRHLSSALSSSCPASQGKLTKV